MPALIPRAPLRVRIVNYRPPWKHQVSAENKYIFFLMILHPVLKQATGNKRAPPEFEKGMGKSKLCCKHRFAGHDWASGAVYSTDC